MHLKFLTEEFLRDDGSVLTLDHDMERCPASLAIRKMQIQSTRYHVTPTQTQKTDNNQLVVEDVEELKHGCIAGRNAKQYFEKTTWQFEKQNTVTL